MPHTHNIPSMKPYRRDLRKHGTPAEGGMWARLKGRQVGGLLFRRQFSIDNYILDFYCPELKVALELDGESHMSHLYEDRQRDQYLLERYGIKTIRYENRHVFERPQQIINDILEEARRQGKCTSTAPSTPPPLQGAVPLP